MFGLSLADELVEMVRELWASHETEAEVAEHHLQVGRQYRAYPTSVNLASPRLLSSYTLNTLRASSRFICDKSHSWNGGFSAYTKRKY